jgi:transposase-like protein
MRLTTSLSGKSAVNSRRFHSDCHNCQSICNRFGKHRNGLQRFRCSQCKRSFTEDHTRPLADMRLPMDKAESILKLLVEGMSLRSIERVTGVHRDTIMRLLLLAGERSQKLMDEKMRNLQSRYLQVDEIWTYCASRGLYPKIRQGNPDPDHISTSFVERQNLTMRMQLRRFTRLTNAFSKKLSHLKAAVGLHFAWYNFCRVHGTLRVTPAMEAHMTDHVWSISEMLAPA